MSCGQEPRPQIPHPPRVCGETQVKMEPEKKVSVLISPPSRLALNTAPPEEEEEMI